MKTAGAIQVPVRRHVPAVPLAVAAGALLFAIGAGILWQDLASGGVDASEPVRIEQAVPAAQGEEIVSRAGVAQILRHRPGISAASVVRAVGSDTIEGLGSPALTKALRLRDGLSPMQLKRLEARRG